MGIKVVDRLEGSIQGDYPGLSACTQGHHMVSYSKIRRQKGQGRVMLCETAEQPWLTLKMEEGARSQGMWLPLEARKARKQTLPLALQRKHSPLII
jgi:hypothetical protein